MGSILIPSTTDDGTPLATSSFFQAFSVDPARGVDLLAALEAAETKLATIDLSETSATASALSASDSATAAATSASAAATSLATFTDAATGALMKAGGTMTGTITIPSGQEVRFDTGGTTRIGTASSILTVTSPTTVLAGGTAIPLTVTSGKIAGPSGQTIAIGPGSTGQGVNIGNSALGVGVVAQFWNDSAGNPTTTNPNIETVGHRLDVFNRLRAGFIHTLGSTYTLEATNTTGPKGFPRVLNLVSNWNGVYGSGGLLAPYNMSVAADTVDGRAASNAITMLLLAKNFGGTGTYGSRSLMRGLLSCTSAFNDTTTSQQFVGVEMWLQSAFNTGGTGWGETAHGSWYPHNPQVLIQPGSTYNRLANGFGEVNLAVYATAQTLTLGGTVTAGDVLSITFTSASIPSSPVTVSYTTGTGQTLTMVANNLMAKVQRHAGLRSVGVGASAAGAVVNLFWPHPMTVTVSTSATGSGTTTRTLSGVTQGGSSDVKLMMSLIRLAEDSGTSNSSAFLMLGSQGGASNAGQFHKGIVFGGLADYDSAWGIRPDGTLIEARYTQTYGGVGKTAPLTPATAYRGVDWTLVNFTESSGHAFASSGFLVDGKGSLNLAGTTITTTSTSTSIDTTGVRASAVAVSAGGGGGSGSAPNNYFPDEIVYDDYSGQYRIDTINPATGAVTGLTMVSAPSVIGATPSNPVATKGGSGTGLTLTLTWPASTLLALQPSGGRTTLGGPLQLRASTPPATSSSTGTTGQVEWDSGFLYVCTATNTWKRATLATF